MENSTDLLLSFHQQLDRSIQRVMQTNAHSDYISTLATEVQALVETAQQVGNSATQQLTYQDEITANTLPPFLITHRWSERVKAFLILWRNVLLEAQKGQILQQENKITSDILANLRTQSLTQIASASEALKGQLERARGAVNSAKGGAKQQIEQWRLQKNPWETYQQQLAQIPDQCSLLAETQQKLIGNTNAFQDIREQVQQVMNNVKQDIESIKERATETVDYIHENVEEKPGKIAVHLEGMEAKISMPNHVKTFSQQLEPTTNQLSGKVAVPITAIGGMVQTKDINFRKSTTAWLESEIMPLLYEVEEVTENIENGMKMAIINIRNRALLIDKEQKATEGETDVKVSKSVICQPLSTFIQNCEKWENDIEKLFRLIKMRLNNQLKVGRIYEAKEDFLTIPLQSTINQLRQNQNEFVTNIRTWWDKRTAFITRLKKDVAQESTLTDAEKIARFIETYRPAADNPQYANIFLTRGYVGDSFWVGREAELAHTKRVIDQWRNGFRGSLLLTGQRFSGKTLFGDTVANRYFANQTIRIAPNSVLRLNGRRLKMDYELAPVLQFIKDNTLNEQPLVWLDDLELWTDANVSYAENIRQLRTYIDRYSNRIFFMIATSNWQRAHLAKTFDLDQFFQAEINLDRMGLEEIRRAILIRHGATHKTLVDKTGEKTSPQDFARMTKRIYAATEGNIGNALNRWSAATERYNEDKVTRNADNAYQLPDFINADNGILLHAITMKKRTNDYRLRKLFGPAFQGRFKQILQRLIGMGLVKRSIDGYLEVNEVAANEIAYLLEQHELLQFHH